MPDFSKNYFELFGLSVDFAIDSTELASRYRELQRAVHPDRFASGTEQEKRLSMQGASRINDAFETLKHPLSRARYMLELQGVDVAGASGNTSDTLFLMEQIELREEMEAARGQADPYGAIAKLMDHIQGLIQQQLDEIAAHLEAATAESLEQALDIHQKLQFLYKLRTQTEELEAELDDEL
jgi:molecular chaperone HscB